jgi:molecular chaperone GrpE
VHEAVSKEPAEGVASGTIARAIARGYALEGRVLRPARVIVAE